MGLKIATWNVNSVRARLGHVTRWLSERQPDVLCLQETKVIDAEFPTDTFSRLGYDVARTGQKSYNGVALISRHRLDDVKLGLCDAAPSEDRRLISATVLGVRIYSAYVPNGKSLDSPSYLEKLAWLRRLQSTLEADPMAHGKLVVCGDFNVARTDLDVFDPAKMRGQLHFSQPEHDAIEDLLSCGLFDALRELHPGERVFSWWDYRMGSFRRDRGLRIDYVFVSEALRPQLTASQVDREPRGWDKPSDHAPVVVELSI